MGQILDTAIDFFQQDEWTFTQLEDQTSGNTRLAKAAFYAAETGLRLRGFSAFGVRELRRLTGLTGGQQSRAVAGPGIAALAMLHTPFS